MNLPHKLLQLPTGGAGLEVLTSGLAVGTDVHVQLILVGLGVHHARLAGQQEGTQPQGVHLQHTPMLQLLEQKSLHAQTQNTFIKASKKKKPELILIFELYACSV